MLATPAPWFYGMGSLIIMVMLGILGTIMIVDNFRYLQERVTVRLRRWKMREMYDDSIAQRLRGDYMP